MKNHFVIFLLICCVIFMTCCKYKTSQNTDHKVVSSKKEKNKPFPKWEEGYFDIHHINTGSGNACFMIFPDGTTMIFDAGEVNKKQFEKRRSPMKMIERKPNASLSVAEWTSMYIKKTMPTYRKPTIDYALTSHFHSDHFAGLVKLGQLTPIQNIIDRNAPNYDFPFDLKRKLKKNKKFMEYLSFIESTKIPIEALEVGVDSQIRLLHSLDKYPAFKVRNVKSNATIWTGKGEETFEYFTAEDMLSFYKGKYNENPLSLALKISYGDFDYFTGGDNTGLQGFGLPRWFDVETPIAKAVGKVEVMNLNHHGNRDANNAFFVKTLDPKVVVQQSWCSGHIAQEVYQRLIYQDENTEERDIFATYAHDATNVIYGSSFSDNYKSTEGHIVVRVYPGGQKYEVIILNDNTTALTVKAMFGPYTSK